MSKQRPRGPTYLVPLMVMPSHLALQGRSLGSCDKTEIAKLSPDRSEEMRSD